MKARSRHHLLWFWRSSFNKSVADITYCDFGARSSRWRGTDITCCDSGASGSHVQSMDITYCGVACKLAFARRAPGTTYCGSGVSFPRRRAADITYCDSGARFSPDVVQTPPTVVLVRPTAKAQH